MKHHFQFTRRAARMWVAAGAAVALMGTATWEGLAASPHADTPAPATVSTPIAHDIASGRDSYADIVDVVSPAVVTVHVKGHARASDTQLQLPDDFFGQFFGQQGPDGRQFRQPRARRVEALGSGVVVSADGYILTNYHVVDGADDVTIEFTDGRTLDAKVIGTDKPSDLALLKVDAANLKPIALGNSDAVKVGDVALAVGNPLGVGQTVTMGIISAKGRSTDVGNGSYEDFLQTDAPINHGNSGGALVNMKGELIGINSQILSNSDGNIGIGFAIPVNMARNVMTQLRTSGKVTRSQLGVMVQTVSPDMAESLGLKQVGGVIVSSVTPGSAADHAGLKRGDVIMSMDGQPVHDMNALRNRVAETKPGTTTQLVIVRDGAEQHLTATLESVDAGRLASNDTANGEGSGDRAALGVTVAPLTPELASQLHVPDGTKGLVVRDVDPDGRAADANIQSGDVIEQVNRQPVTSVDQLREALRRTGDRPALLLLNHRGNDIYVTVRPDNS